MVTGQNFIGYDRSAQGDQTYQTFNPILNIENPEVFYEATSEEIDRAVNKANQAFLVYRNISGARKAEFLKAIADEIMALDDTLVKMYCKETGLPEGRAKGERGRTVFQLQTFAQLLEEGSWVDATIDTAIPEREPIPKPDLRKMRVPLGPVVVFGASNFPLAYSTAGGDTASALAAGCPVIVKSHPMHAGTGELVATAISSAAQKTGMPDGVFSNLNSAGIEVGVKLVRHPEVKAIGFTGSIAGGRALFDEAAKRSEPIPVFAEMGSINPVVILPDALKTQKDKWAKAYAQSITLGSGQFCTNPGLLLGIKSQDLSEFVNDLAEEIVHIEPTCMLHPNIIGAYEKKKGLMKQESNLNIIMEYPDDVAVNYARQAITTVDGNTFIQNPSLHQEIFGPFSMIVQCENSEQLAKILGELEGQLTGTIISSEDEIKDYSQVVESLGDRVGRIIFNGVPTGVEVAPAMLHGGPYPASTDSRFTAVGRHAIERWVRPFSYQNWPDELLPDELKNSNPLNITRLVNGEPTNQKL
ncbi:MAG: aldehyde dehydrogenase (NADP(+)) [Bacteroidia bacterium]|nr:aldehyde dehydrogenase (NADP(+)) [Bacteroidia bacterium]MBT8268562.1 aldehyde dehydrogenase (NADP(+)) [Bacteroidia bacterium]NNF82116.1 aldehyde dehydrogenase (NADP(+)) [Flavobacteriaceae bacterium]